MSTVQSIITLPLRRWSDDEDATSLYDPEALAAVIREQTQAHSDDGAPWTLRVDQGPGAGTKISVRQGSTVLGRAPKCGLRVDHPSVSRHHAELLREGERFFIKDLHSQNGTFLNGVRLESERELFPGDRVDLGHARLELLSDSALKKSRNGRRNWRNGILLVVACLAGFVLAAGVAWLRTRSTASVRAEVTPPANPPWVITSDYEVRREVPEGQVDVPSPPMAPVLETPSPATEKRAPPPSVRRRPTRPQPQSAATRVRPTSPVKKAIEDAWADD